ncbi:FCD domain-containing protein [Paracoccus sp. MBLB3053]|uniref:FCD domain-containing protein n=1 Tax=Paracoccus aurantius TaxID=3073814 RepID=A0ABU2HWP6_9RHOB|nr:FCD domain-containing protein [Paracoccus sp. MBLB3053]MDS9469172.1 FCD domain-containing protein [Paracoccus sp. MBLB3053]
MHEDDSKLPVTEMVTRRIQEMIRSGEIPKNSKLPSQRILAQQLGVSRTSLREALLTLETLGLLRTLPARGTFVRETGPGAAQAAMTWRYDAQFSLSEVFETRAMVETEMCRLAAAVVTPARLDEISDAARMFEGAWRSGDLVAHVDADLRFHSLIAETCSNSMLRMLYRSIHAVLTESQRAPIPNTAVSRMEASISEHQAIVRALRSHNPSVAAEAMRRHIENTAAIAGVDLRPV